MVPDWREGGKTNSRVTVILLSVLSWRRLLNNWFFPDVEERKREREKSEPKLRRELSQSSTFFLSWERKLLVGCLDWRREYSLKFILRSLPYNLHHHELRLLQKPRIEPSLESDTQIERKILSLVCRMKPLVSTSMKNLRKMWGQMVKQITLLFIFSSQLQPSTVDLLLSQALDCLVFFRTLLTANHSSDERSERGQREKFSAWWSSVSPKQMKESYWVASRLEFFFFFFFLSYSTLIDTAILTVLFPLFYIPSEDSL